MKDLGTKYTGRGVGWVGGRGDPQYGAFKLRDVLSGKARKYSAYGCAPNSGASRGKERTRTLG